MPASKKEKKLVRAEQARTGVCYTEALTRVRLRNNAPRNQAPEMTMTPNTNPDDFDAVYEIVVQTFEAALSDARTKSKKLLVAHSEQVVDVRYLRWTFGSDTIHAWGTISLQASKATPEIDFSGEIRAKIHLPMPEHKQALFGTVLRLAAVESAVLRTVAHSWVPEKPADPATETEIAFNQEMAKYRTNANKRPGWWREHVIQQKFVNANSDLSRLALHFCLSHRESEPVIYCASAGAFLLDSNLAGYFVRNIRAVRDVWPDREAVFRKVQDIQTEQRELSTALLTSFEGTPEYLHPDGGYTDESYNHMNNPFAEAVSDEP